MSIFIVLLLLFGASQIYWSWRGYKLAARIRRRGVRLAVCVAAVAVWLVLYLFNFGPWRARATPIHLTLRDALLSAPFLWWAATSVFSCLIVILFAIPRALVWAVRRLTAGPEIQSPARRGFLEQTANAAAAVPFVAGAYGLLYGRLNLEIKPQTIPLPHLPRAFEGFRILQLSDIHIGPFMPAEEIRKYVTIANAQRPDMIVLTGDFVTFDGSTQWAVVDALRGLRAPFGVYGCLGNHDAWCLVEDSITALFRQNGVQMLRGETAPVAIGNESFNLIGVDFQSPHRFGPSPAVTNLLGNIAGFVEPGRVNILLSHNPDTFDRAAEMGIDLSLAGHTHGGQAALEFISPEIAPSRLATPYVAGWFRKPGGQLYVNRGIGTIFIPIRIGAPPEITVYKLSRGEPA